MEDASLTTKGVVKLSSAVDSTSESLAATPKAVKAANDNANSRVPSNRKVNGKALTADITLTPKDIGTLNSVTMSFSGGAGWFKLATVTMPQASSIVYIALIGGAGTLTPKDIGTLNSVTMSFSGGAGWFKLATVTMPQASSIVYIALIGGAGYNVGSPHQAGISELVLRAGNGNPKGITGALWKRTAVGLTNFAWINTSGDTYDIYVEIGNYATSVNIHWDCTANATVSIYTSPTYSASKPSSVTDGVVYTMYSTHQKPTPLDIGALPTTGGTVSGPLSVTGGITGTLNGNASTATKLQTARSIGGVGFDGSANINLPGVNTTGNQNTTGNAATATKLQTARSALWKRTAVGLTNFAWINTSGDTYDIYVEIGNYATSVNIHWDCTANATVSIYTSPTYSASKPSSVTDGVVYTMYSTHQKPTPLDIGALPTTGGTVSGPLSVTGGITGTLNGNASTATKLQTARSIGGVGFDGSANINLPGVNTTGNQNTTGNAATATKLQTARTIGGVSFDGTANINLPGVNTTGNQNTTGNAATATKLQTARTINGVSFDGSANISLSPANIGCPASPTGWLTTGSNGGAITTAQLVTLLQNNGAFNTKSWIARCAWAYANSATIPNSETGCGVIPLAGAVIEVFNNGSSSNNYTIRITTATTTSVSGALTNAEFIYVFNGTDYSPGWRRVYNTKNKPTASDVGALPLTGGTLSGGLTSSGEIISKYANGFRIAYGSFGFFIRNDGSNTYFMLTASGDTLGSWNGLRPITINNTSGAVSIGNGLNVTGGVNGSLNGNASTATKLQTARNINGVKFDGSGDININTLVSRGRVTALSGSTQGTAGIQMYEAYNNSYPTTYGNVLHMKGASAAGEGELLIGWSGTSGAHAPVFIRSRRDTTDAAWSAWAQVYTAKDSIPGVNTTGNQNTTGNAATATKLQTARKIAGVAFDGSADITLTAANLNAYTKTEVTNLLSSYASRSSLTGYSGNLDIIAETLVVKSGGSGGFAIWDIGTTTSGANMYIDPNPGINTVWRSTSSRRYKKDIETLQDRYADELLSLRPVWYRSICRGDRKDWGYYGLIAEEVGEIAPQYVHWREPTNNDSPEDISSNGMVAEGVMYERLVVPLIHHIQQLTKRVEELETKLNSPKE